MKKIYLSIFLLSIWYLGFSQDLQEITNTILFEHHMICCPGSRGDSSAWNFVNHEYINSTVPSGPHSDRDMVEHNGLVVTNITFGFTSGVSSIWNGAIAGNGLTKYYLKNNFDYENATQENLINAYNEDEATLEINTVNDNDIYIARIRGLEYYVVIKITGVNVESNNDFRFDYKYTDAVLSVNEIYSPTLFSVYPNPVKNDIHIKLDDFYKSIYVSIRDVLGNEVLNQRFTDKSRIDLISGVESLSDGLYLILILADNKKSTLKIIKKS